MIAEKQDIKSIIESYGVLSFLGSTGRGFQIQQSPSELATFIEYCLAHDVKTVLELGSADGGLSYLLADAFGMRVTSVDVVPPKHRHENNEFICLTTDDAYKYLQHRAFDLLIVDADHAYESVKADHERYAHLAKIVMLHDVNVGRKCCEGVARYWDELTNERAVFIENLPGYTLHNYGGNGDNFKMVVAQGGQDAPGIGWYKNDNQYTKPPILEVYAQPLPDATTDINVVSGTYNRLTSLKRMIESARASVPYGITLRFTIVDGGSTDGSLEYLRTQPDVTLIEHGELRGIKAAYRDGFDAATGKYIVTGNDDVEYIGDCLYQALCYLETHPDCVATAFHFDNPDKPGHFHVNYQGVEIKGKKEYTPYAQIGLFCKWAGDIAGWWGGHDETFKSNNYGVDNYLASRLLEMGYTTHALERCRFHDHLVQDDLRNHNAGHILRTGKHPDSQAWLDRFNQGYPVWNSTPVKPQETEHLRILYTPILAGRTEDERKQLCGLLQSFQKVAVVTVYDYTTAHKQGRNVEAELCSLITSFKPHIWHTQIQNTGIITPHIFKLARSKNPSMIVTNWNGDENRYVWQDKPTLDIMQCCDLHLTVNPAQLGNALQHGVNAAFWPDSYQPVEPIEMPAFDVVFCGSNYAPKHSPKTFPRRDMIDAIRARFPQLKIGVYGTNWTHSEGEHTYDYAANHGTYAAAKLVIVDNMYRDQWGYMSDRLWNGLAYADHCLVQATEGLDVLFGLERGRASHYLAWDTLEGLCETIDYLLNPEWGDNGKPRIEKPLATAQDFVRKYHSFDARVRQYLDLLPAISKKKC